MAAAMLTSCSHGRSGADFWVCLAAGFGEFHGVKSNPTQQLVDSLPSFLSAHPLPADVSVSSLTVLETSAVGARDTLHQLRQAAATTTATAAGPEEAQAAPVAPTCHRIWVRQSLRVHLEEKKAMRAR